MQFSRIENTLEQSKVGASILSRISKTRYVGRTESELSEGRGPWEVAGCSVTKLVWIAMAGAEGKEGRGMTAREEGGGWPLEEAKVAGSKGGPVERDRESGVT